MNMNRWRNIALGLMFLSFIIMYIGLLFKNRHVLPYFFMLGSVCLFVSIAIYFRLGALSFNLRQIECPNCGRMTKVLGTSDGCMFCKTPFRKTSSGEWVRTSEAGHEAE